MEPHKKIPYKLNKYRNRLGHFITYWGDIYSGSLWELPNYDEGFFVIPNYHLTRIHEMEDHEKSPEKFRKLGYEINDHRVIKKYIAGDFNSSPFNRDPVRPITFTSDLKFRKMFVFGAGASAFCCFDDQALEFEKDGLHPPTGFEIFHERYDEVLRSYIGTKFSVPEFESRGNNIEDCLEGDWLRYRSVYNPQIAMRHINMQYYLQDLFQRVTERVNSKYFRKNLYGLFANKLQKYCATYENDRPTIVSFNYDTILEHFIQLAFGTKYEYLDDYIDWDNRNVIMFKPHGSSNWGWSFPKNVVMDINGQNLSNWLYENKLEPYHIFYELLGDLSEMVYSYSYGYELGDDEDDLSKYSLNKQKIEVMTNTGQYYPAMLLPYRNKDELVMPYNHMTALDLVMQKVEELYLIGWKGNEKLFNQKLKRRLINCKLLVIVNPESKEVMDNLNIFLNPTKLEIKCIDTFEEFILRYFDTFLNQ